MLVCVAVLVDTPVLPVIEGKVDTVLFCVFFLLEAGNEGLDAKACKIRAQLHTACDAAVPTGAVLSPKGRLPRLLRVLFVTRFASMTCLVARFVTRFRVRRRAAGGAAELGAAEGAGAAAREQQAPDRQGLRGATQRQPPALGSRTAFARAWCPFPPFFSFFFLT